MSDDDLIRRGDAREILEDGGFLERSLDRLAALPERGVPIDCRKWDYYPIEMPLTKDGHGPAIPGRDEIARITYEVWDRTLETHASFDNLPDAINEAMRLSLATLTPTDAAQAREAAQAMLDLHDSFLAGKDVDIAAANRLHLAASFGAQAFTVCPVPDARPSAMLRAFLLALIDPMHSDLDYLRRVNMARPVEAPTMTDMMVDPDTLDAFMEAKPLPPDPAAIRILALIQKGAADDR